MKTIKNVVGLKSVSSLLIAFILILGSCSKTDDSVFNATETQDISSETATDSFTDEVNDVSNISVAGVSDLQYDGGRTEGEPVTNLKDIDDRLKCATVTIARTPNSTKANPVGTITIDFGIGCTDSRGVIRKGKIIVSYVGKRFFPGSSITTTFDGYFRNEIKIEGTHVLTNAQANLLSNPKFTVVIRAGKLTFADGKTVTREQSFTREWKRATSPNADKWVVLKGSEASGSSRNGKTYTMEVTADLVYSRACAISDKVFIAVSGTKSFLVDGKNYIVDYGNGNCDNEITVKVNGVSKTFSVKPDGN